MVKAGSKRVMITCTPKTIELAQELQDIYDMTFTQLVKYLVAKEAAERKDR